MVYEISEYDEEHAVGQGRGLDDLSFFTNKVLVMDELPAQDLDLRSAMSNQEEELTERN